MDALHPDQRKRLFDALIEQRAVLADDVARAVAAAVASYGGVDPEVHRAGALEVVGFAIEAIQVRSIEADSRRLERLITVTRERAAQGVPLDDMVRGWHLGFRLLVERARATGTRLGLDEEIVLDFVDAAIHVTERTLQVVHEAHRRGASIGGDAEEREREAFVTAALRGTIPATKLHARATEFGLAVDRLHIVLRARPTRGHDLVRLRRDLRLERGRPGNAGLAAVLDGDLVAILPARPATAPDGVLAGVGEPAALVDLPNSLRLATRSLDSAASFGLTGVHDLGSLGLRAAVAADRDLGRALIARYVIPVAAEPSGTSLLASVAGWLAAGGHVGRASERLFIHPNTLRYRLSRFESLTGTDLRDRHAATEVWWALEYARLTEGVSPAGD